MAGHSDYINPTTGEPYRPLSSLGPTTDAGFPVSWSPDARNEAGIVTSVIIDGKPVLVGLQAALALG